jgi:hypothetical protein
MTKKYEVIATEYPKKNMVMIVFYEEFYHTDDQILDLMVEWCEENGGHRTSYNHFKFKTAEDRTMFILRWQ